MIGEQLRELPHPLDVRLVGCESPTRNWQGLVLDPQVLIVVEQTFVLAQ